MARQALDSTTQIYERVAALKAGGVSGQAAFNQVAKETGKNAGTVQAAYYRAARKAGTVQYRPRKKSAPERETRTRRTSVAAAAGTDRAQPGSSDEMAAKLEEAARLLGDAANEIRALQADAARWREVSKLLASA
jgi:hypothetical protein